MMEKTAIIIFVLGTLGMITVLLDVQMTTMCSFQYIPIILTCVGMECCSLLPIIIETENKDYDYEL